jgi:hypothetical protein
MFCCRPNLVGQEGLPYLEVYLGAFLIFWVLISPVTLCRTSSIASQTGQNYSCAIQCNFYCFKTPLKGADLDNAGSATFKVNF